VGFMISGRLAGSFVVLATFLSLVPIARVEA
jgi:hypothetical protein